MLVVAAILLGVFRPPTQLFVFVLLLNYAMPTAVNMSVRLRDRRSRVACTRWQALWAAAHCS